MLSRLEGSHPTTESRQDKFQGDDDTQEECRITDKQKQHSGSSDATPPDAIALAGKSQSEVEAQQGCNEGKRQHLVIP